MKRKIDEVEVTVEERADSPAIEPILDENIEKKIEGTVEEENKVVENLDDEDVDGEGYEFVIHDDLDNIVSLTMQQTLEQDDATPNQFRFSHSTTAQQTNLSEKTQLAYAAMKHFGITQQNYHSFCVQIGKKHTPFEIDLIDEELNSERPWRRPGASLDDFFNYGFNEHSWKEYAARQVALRLKVIKNITDEEIATSNQENLPMFN